MYKLSATLALIGLLGVGALALPVGRGRPLAVPMASAPAPSAPPVGLSDVLGVSVATPASLGEVRLAHGAGFYLFPPWGGSALAAAEAVDPFASPALLRRLAGRAVVEASARVSAAESGLRPFADTERFLDRQGQLDRPVSGRVRFGYGPVARTTSNTAHRHTGVTYRVTPASEVRSVSRGIVSHAAALSDYGGVVIIDHGSGFHSVYALLDTIVVEPGQPVSTGQRLGNARDSARADIYFEIRYRGRPLDPADWIAGAR